MVRSVIVFIAILLLILFALSNVHQVPLRFIAGEPLNVRLIYLFLFAYFLGVMTTAYFYVLAGIVSRRKKKKLKDQTSVMIASEKDDSLDIFRV